VTRRDTSILIVVGIIGVIGAFWLLLLAPKRSELRTLDRQVTEAQDAANSARQDAEQFSRDRLQYPQAYAALVRLGKAVPADPDVPSLLLQLNQAARSAGVDFQKINLDTGGGTASSTPASQPPSAPQQSSQSGAQASQGAGATGQSGAASSGAGATGGSSSSGASAPTPATAVSAATVPVGTTVGAAGFPTLKMELSFQGSFFKLADFVRNVRTLVRHRNASLLVSGRLLTIDGISFGEGDVGFPHIKATILATAYVVPATQGLLAGATPQGPGGATASTPTPASAQASGAAPPAAVVRP
jgi:Tfp pilus assembly protein PilO